ncbi:MAG: hypothetical protein Q9191_001284 [Dirinaria sp. TL-2023a]
MTQPGGMPGSGSLRGASPNSTNGYSYPPHERGSRRRKLAGYLKAANELRQSYLGSDGPAGEDYSSTPGSFPELASARNGHEEMILFPSYARRHYPRKSSQGIPEKPHDLRSSNSTGDPEYWRREWEKHEDDTCIVDVDVRGWIYSPHRGPMSRKNKILVGIARRLSGIPAPSGDSRSSSPSSSVRSRIESHASRKEEEQIEREAETIARRGEGEADVAWRGGFSEISGHNSDQMSVRSSPAPSRTASPDKELSPRVSARSNNGSIYDEGASSISSLEKRTSLWSQPQDMTPAEIAAANAHLMSRLKPFLHIPLIDTSLTVFFDNDKTSKSRSLTTNESGHFSIRTPLDFVPTHVRVLASDKLSATEEVRVTEPKGVSVISDIDDTIKHSGIGNGAKEIFRNVFIRELSDLTIPGVKEWYSNMASTGAQFHYVSNAPWQLYPILTSFFAMAGLPKGTYHLKQYNGMLQGIFEPVAERKKASLDKIIQDFPERRFILVGDSGEADLELYTEIVLANPGRVLGVFIRDVTTVMPQGYFDSSAKPLRERGSQSPTRTRQKDGRALSPQKSMPDLAHKPDLPPRPSIRSVHSIAEPEKTGPTMGQLIDYDEQPEASEKRSSTVPKTDNKESTASEGSPPPRRPSKPTALRNGSGDLLKMTPLHSDPKPSSPIVRRPVPPPKPRQLSRSQDSTQPLDRSPLSQTQMMSPPGSRSSSPERQSYRATVREKVASAYNSLPAWSSSTQSQQQASQPPSRLSPADDLNRTQKLPPPVPPRRGLSSYPAAAAHYASNRLSGGWSGNDSEYSKDDPGGYSNSRNSIPQMSKREEIWKRRWARAKELLNDKGVMLRSWRNGDDVMDETLKLIESTKKEKGGA